MKKLTIMVFSVGLVSLGAAKAEASCGTFEVAKGDVKVQSGEKLTPAGVGSKICSGDAVVAGADSRAKIKMEDGNELNISPNSKIVLEQYQYNPSENKKNVLLNVLKGKVRATTREENMYNDKSKDGQANAFQVRTKSAVAGVRGTDFLTSFDPSTNKSGIVTFRGKVEFGQPGPGGKIVNAVQVPAGQTTEAVGGRAPEPPKPVPPKELQKMNSESKADGPKSGDSASTDKSAKDKKDDKKKDGDDKSGDKSADKKSDGDKKGGDDKKAAGGPAGDDKKGAGPGGDGDKKGGDSAGGQQAGPGGAQAGPDGGRAPASAGGPMGGGSMLNNNDLGGGAGFTAPTLPNMPNIPVMPTMNLPPTMPTCDFCADQANRTSNVKIIINTGP